ncbi:MAG: bifunctional folylpolyglutamate synthase/dihydrofolate synthase [Acidobacteria bacterium]|nr:bifunctional folylpolyglutamate synthase/dihydrofolate synthase [Acidobacteriota bacterium]
MKAAASDVRARLFGLEQIGIKLGLDQINGLLDRLGRPDLAFPSIAVAGTNGKGSVAAMLERGVRAAGYRTGRYTSPHLADVEERIVVDGRPVRADVFDAAAERVLDAGRGLPFPPTFFEATTALALDVFRGAGVDVAVLEVGMGGRLDATNAVTNVASAITAIDFDHEQYLGDTIEAIAAEKAGIVKPGTVTVLGPNRAAVEAVVAATCQRRGTELVRAREGVTADVTFVDGRATMALRTPEHEYQPLVLALRGRHQVDNAITAIRLLERLSARRCFDVPFAAIRTAVEDVTWPARLELLQAGSMQVLIDGAHNPAGARALASYVGETYGRPMPIVVGVMRDKKVAAILKALAGAASEFVCTSVSTPRAMSAPELVATAATAVPSIPAIAVAAPMDAVRYAAALDSPVVVAGSLYLAGEVRTGLTS